VLDRIDQRDPPLDHSFTYAVTASNVNVYVIDSGIYAAHPYFEGRAFGAYTTIFDQWGTDDGYGHGTLVAGIVASSLYGAAKAARVYSVRVADSNGYGTLSDAIAGINWVTQHHVSPAVANMSFATARSPSMDWAIHLSTNAGVTNVAGAGNDYQDACAYSPAGAPEALTVGASNYANDHLDYAGSLTNIGPCVDLFAPGQVVTSTCAPNRTWPCPNGLYTDVSGTSFAAPYVAAIAAQYLAMYPSASPSTVASAITSNASVGKLRFTPPDTANRLLYAPPACTAPLTTCGYACANLSSDRANCGACGHGCTGTGRKCLDGFGGWYFAGQSCVNSTCVSNPCE
jgi:subtilisin family serine protease